MDNDWRTELSADSRQRIVNKILDTLKRHFPAGDPVGLSVLTTVAALFEEKIFTSAENQADYLRKISLKMLTMETKSAMWNSTASNPTREKRKFARSSMDNGGWMPAQDEGNLVLSDANDWRTELSADSRQRIVNMM
ncbi:mediator of RNA polymerase II transcription subunit 15a [Amborella trichopoda]|uniref:mediator of RNA polymerase II transcription subunit 15a n=1 Tax=Amborella trichopoda TaxID=13333 RepID=UPI0009BE3D4A|nr:mediator of RNA polymerase II transcription subunit 15a [Amborella trichopoda]|eukprot:XP_020525777.1 mediator of RNA polymerase II transcription subunit 15a [Amborella trichopoda]